MPELLAPYDSRWREMGQLARAAWEKSFRAEDEFNYIVDSLAEFKSRRLISERIIRLSWPLILARLHLRRALSRLKHGGQPQPVLNRAST